MSHPLGLSRQGGIRLAIPSALLSLYAVRVGAQAAQALFLASLILVAGTTAKEAAFNLGSLLCASLAASFIFGLPGGALADRMGPHRGLVLGASLRLAVIVTAVVGHGVLPVWLLIFGYSAASQVFTPSETALAGVLRGGANLRCHSHLTILQYAGQAAGALLLAPAAYLIGGVAGMFLVAAAVLALMLLPAMRIAKSHFAEPQPHASRVAGVIEGARFMVRNPATRDAVAVLAIKGVVGRGVLVAIPVFLAQGSTAGPQVGMLLALGALGTGVGLLLGGWSQRWTAETLQRAAMLGIGVGAIGFALLDVGLSMAFATTRMPASTHALTATSLVALGICAFVFGASLSLSLIGAKTILTTVPGPQLQGRVAAAHHLVIDAVLVLPILAAGAAASTIGPRPLIAALGLCALALAAWLHRDLLQALRSWRPAKTAMPVAATVVIPIEDEPPVPPADRIP